MPHAVSPDLMSALALRAVDAAKSAGATYAEARLTRHVEQAVNYNQVGVTVGGGVRETETHGIGVRVLVNGAWGFAASPYWADDEAAQLGKDATAQAAGNAKWISERVELVPTTPAIGSWTTPLRIDPFSIPLEDKVDFYHSLAYSPPFLNRGFRYYASARCMSVSCSRHERTVATSEGSLFAQQFYATSADMTGTATVDWGTTPGAGISSGSLTVFRTLAGAGWEVLQDNDLYAAGPELAEEAYQALALSQLTPMKSPTIGRHAVVFDASTMHGLVASMFGVSLDLDRIMGMDINADGSSYVGSDPLALMGKYDYAQPALSVRAVPSGGRKWDDEGVEPQAYPVVTQGILQDFATTRASATLLAPAYHRLGRPLRSHGCATAGDWSNPAIGGGSDLVLAPGKNDVQFDDMIAAVPHGLAMTKGTVTGDWQGSELEVRGTARAIVNGRLGAFVNNAAVRINASELWKNLMVLGGPNSTVTGSGGWGKGQPHQDVGIAVTAVPAAFTNLAVIDATRRV